jgi:putative intracellular protease/amidase
MIKTTTYQSPVSWTSPGFSLKDYDLIFLPGGHDKQMKQYITSESLHKHLAEYMPLTKKGSSSNKAAVAVCHGVQTLAAADAADGTGNSVIYDFVTTSLTNLLENSVFWGTRLFLGDYYKTFGYGTPNVEEAVSRLVQMTSLLCH